MNHERRKRISWETFNIKAVSLVEIENMLPFAVLQHALPITNQT